MSDPFTNFFMSLGRISSDYSEAHRKTSEEMIKETERQNKLQAQGYTLEQIAQADLETARKNLQETRDRNSGKTAQKEAIQKRNRLFLYAGGAVVLYLIVRK